MELALFYYSLIALAMGVGLLITSDINKDIPLLYTQITTALLVIALLVSMVNTGIPI